MGASFWKLTNGIHASADTADDFGGSDAPKQKFAFTVQFAFRTGLGIKGAEAMEAMDFGIKTSTRPSPIISYHEVNYNNFRTKVAVKSDTGAITITLYDDVTDKAHDIFEHYLKTVSPVANLDKGQADILDKLGQGEGAASLGALETNRHGILRYIRVTHHFGDKKTYYNYLNPKITTMTLDDLDMTVSEAPTITLNFNYDSVHIEKSDGSSMGPSDTGNITLTEFQQPVDNIA